MIQYTQKKIQLQYSKRQVILMANDKIDNKIFAEKKLRISKNRADLHSIYKEIRDYLDFEDVTKNNKQIESKRRFLF